MSPPAVFTIGAALHLFVVFGPALAIRSMSRSEAASFSPAIGMLLAIGLTAFFMADALRNGPSVEPKNHDRDRLARRLALANGLAMLGLCWVSIITSASTAISSPLPWLGLACLLGGTLLRHAAIRALGDDFITEVSVSSSHRLVRRGIFRYLRHPSETGLLLAMFGVAVLLSSGIGLLYWLLILLPLALCRLRLEEAALRAVYGQAYAEYAARVGRLLPRLGISLLLQR
jgi:protein-S-isoprenylcysteine O-methyltransferase Ste14